jgi:hypothetical protein
MVRRRLIYAWFTALTLCATSVYAGSAAPFQGKWEVDKKRTQAPGAPENLQVEIKEDGNKLKIKSKYQEPKSSVYPLLWVGIMTYDLELATDGSPTTNHIGPFTHVSKTTIAGNKMTTDFTATIEKGNVTGQWIRTVSGDGREMTCLVNTKASDGRSLNQTLVFKKK